MLYEVITVYAAPERVNTPRFLELLQRLTVGGPHLFTGLEVNTAQRRIVDRVHRNNFV